MNLTRLLFYLLLVMLNRTTKIMLLLKSLLNLVIPSVELPSG